MSQPARWLWGLIPLALLWGAGNLGLDAAIERDVGERAVQAVAAVAGKTPGARPVLAQVDGRDVTIGGEVLSTDGATKAMAQLRAEFGVRRALGGLSQVVAQKPYSWFASRQAEIVTLGGFVPDLDTAAAGLAAAAAAFPGMRIDDRQSVAFGAPDGFAAMAKAMLAELPKLASGRIALDDGRFCIEGKAVSPEAFQALSAISAQPPQPGFRAVTCDLEPPTVSPYRWSAERAAAGEVVLQGFYPNEDAHKQILATLQRAFGAAVPVRDGLKPGTGAPSAFLEKTARAIGDLARLREGRAELTGDVYTLSGKGPDSHDACQALRLQIAQMDGPDSVAQVAIDCPPPPPAPPPTPVIVPLPDIPGLILNDVLPKASAPSAATAQAPPPAPPPAPVPLDWSATLADGHLGLKGGLPGEAVRSGILAAARRFFGEASIQDGSSVEPALRSDLDIPAATAFALEALSKLKVGSVTLRDKAFAIAGQAADAASLMALRQLLAAAPAGLSVPTLPESVLVRPYGLALSADRTGLRLSGYVPDEATRTALAALVADSPLKGRLDDATEVVPGAPAGFAAAARTAMTDLLRLDLGSASVEDDRVAIRGLTCRELIKSEIETSGATGLPPGFKSDVAIALRQTGCVVDPPASCQNDLDGLTRSNPVLFGQGTSAVALDATTEKVVSEAVAILKKCPGSPVTIEGHANRDGERGGFDNMHLSLRRAMRVRDEIARRGIDPAQLTVKAYGSARPLLPHEAREAKAMNRRVQFTVAK
ncbi:OmpA family protein [Bosea sp. BH3]|uniref:OmpA family protein n=1 Tax=Bosea sp. BH3 TaxID=2871701 RepID=UPI0021CB7011|nr:OmpA family protein [Bosea sp. BH3]MCU4181959.1 OmpA family protein [Bosea sp. BH3]